MKQGIDLLIDRVARQNGGVIRLSRDESGLARELERAGKKAGAIWLRSLLGEMVERGEAVRLWRGVFALRDSHGRFNPLAIGPRLVDGRAYASMWSVAARARLSYNEPRLVSIVADRQVRHSVLPCPALDTAFYFHQVDAGRFFGFTEQPLGDGLTTPLASVEKSLIDMLWFGQAPDVAPASEQIEMWAAAADNSSGVNPKLLVRQAIAMRSPAIARRVGYLMERSGMPYADELLPHRGAAKERTPVFAGEPEALLLPANKWMVS